VKTVFEITRSISCNRRLPKNFQSADRPIFVNEIAREIPAIYLVEGKNMTIDINGRFFRSGLPVSIVSFQRQRESLKMLIRRFVAYWIKRTKKQTKKQIENVLWLTDDWSHGYFHWFTETYPVLNMLSELNLLTGYQLVLPSHYLRYKYVIESLNAISIVPFFPNPNAVVQAKKLRTISTAIIPGNYNPEIILRLRNQLSILPKGVITGRRFYCSRQKAEKRKIKNEDEIIPILTSHKFQLIWFELLTFDEQRSLMSSADWLIGQHGAGLTNMIIMKEGGNVVELRKTFDGSNNCYFSLASALGLNYYYLQCEAETSNDHNSDIIVDPIQLKLFLEAYCS
jgi:capsular polysaccharide biosynthesis protein